MFNHTTAMKKSSTHEFVWLADLVCSLPAGWGCIGALVYSVRLKVVVLIVVVIWVAFGVTFLKKIYRHPSTQAFIHTTSVCSCY